MKLPVRQARGVTFVYVAVGLVAIVGMLSLAVDYGRVQMAKTELRRAADAAARAGVAGLGNWSTAQSLAVQYAASNNFDGAPLVLDTTPNKEIEFGTWDEVDRTFDRLNGINRNYANAIRITVKRTINLFFSRFIGITECDVSAISIACQAPSSYGVVGLDFITMSGTSSNSYWSSAVGSPTYSNAGSIASNGDITLNGSASVRGNAHPGIGKQVNGASNVYGSTTPLTTTLVYPNGNASPYSLIVNDNALLPVGAFNGVSFDTGNQTRTVQSGYYFVKDLTVTNAGAISALGAVTFYVYGTVDIKGIVSTSGNLPKNFAIVMVPDPVTSAVPGNVTLRSNAEVYATVYAPQSTITFSGGADLYGSIVGKSVTMSGGAAIHYDLSLINGGGIVMVR